MTLRIDRRVLQELAAAATLIAAFVIAREGKWVFAETLPVTRTDPTFAQQVLSNRTTIGFVRFGLVLLALYVIASVPALVVGGRIERSDRIVERLRAVSTSIRHR